MLQSLQANIDRHQRKRGLQFHRWLTFILLQNIKKLNKEDQRVFECFDYGDQ